MTLNDINLYFIFFFFYKKSLHMYHIKLNYPNSILQLIKNKKYQESIEICKHEKLNIKPIMDLIEEEIQNSINFYENGDFLSSINIYINLIGVYDPGFVVAKLYNQNLESFLEDYLIELHKKGFSSSKYTKLLFYLLVQRKSIEKLKSLVSLIEVSQKLKKENNNNNLKKTNYQKFLSNFDVDVAIDILSKNGYEEEAKLITNAVGISIHMISAMIYQQKKYLEASKHIFSHYDEPIGYTMLMRFGPIILNNDQESGKIIEQTAAMMWRSSLFGEEK